MPEPCSKRMASITNFGLGGSHRAPMLRRLLLSGRCCMTLVSSAASLRSWRTPMVVVLCGCLIAVLTAGPRTSVGQFLTPLSLEHGWGRDVFSFAIAIQNLLWGLGQPLAGGI